VDVLVVEDDVQVAELLESVLRDEGHAFVVCGTMQEAREALVKGPFDLVLLDRMLPDGDGLELCAMLKDRVPPLPVLLLTAVGETTDRVEGLRAGADDYVVKPFDVEELLARMDAVCRRVQKPWVTKLGDLEIDLRGRVVRAAGRRLDLTARELALLARLAEKPGECVPRATLLADVWNLEFDPGSGVIDFHVSRLREKLGSLAWMVETIRGKGLRLRTSA
jgi:two-component system, OmpR family, response regulator